MDSDFIERLNSQISKFRKAIMRDYWDYKKQNPVRHAFFGCDITTQGYQIQKYFEVRLEDYLRRYLLNGFLGRVLESRGNGIYPITPEKKIEPWDHYTNQEYEQLVQYEFVADFLNSDKRVGVRYTEYSPDDFQPDEDINEICVIQWNNNGKESSKETKLLEDGTIISRCSVRSFMLEHGFSEDEYNEYLIAVTGMIDEVQELIGIKSVPSLNSTFLSGFRFEAEKALKEHVSEMFNHSDTEKKILKEFPDLFTDIPWAYHIIDDEKKRKYPNLEHKTEKLLIDDKALATYRDRRYYQALIGKSDFAKSFITSEYLYRQYDSNDQFDYTAVISGYIKCVEQLLYKISLFAIDKKLLIKSTGKKLEDKTTLPFQVEFSSKHLNDRWYDTTMGSLTYFLFGNKQNQGFIIDDGIKQDIFKCLQCYADECRNDSFHKHNVDSWSRVEYIRNNTMVIIEIILGLCNLGENQTQIDNNLGIVRDDRLERVFQWIISVKADSFYIKFEDEEQLHVTLSKSSEYPSFDNGGFIRDYMIFLESVDEIDNITRKPRITFIKRDRLPDKMWYTDSLGKTEYFS